MEEVTDGAFDLAYLRDLLSLLKDMDVAAFNAGGITVSFKSPEVNDAIPGPDLKGRTRLATIKDEDKSTSSQPVAGFGTAPQRDGWKNPALWPDQNGRVLKLNGEYE